MIGELLRVAFRHQHDLSVAPDRPLQCVAKLGCLAVDAVHGNDDATVARGTARLEIETRRARRTPSVSSAKVKEPAPSYIMCNTNSRSWRLRRYWRQASGVLDADRRAAPRPTSRKCAALYRGHAFEVSDGFGSIAEAEPSVGKRPAARPARARSFGPTRSPRGEFETADCRATRCGPCRPGPGASVAVLGESRPSRRLDRRELQSLGMVRIGAKGGVDRRHRARIAGRSKRRAGSSRDFRSSLTPPNRRERGRFPVWC